MNNIGKLHKLPATNKTVHVGIIDPRQEPVLEIDSGDEVEIETWTHWGNAVGPETTFEDLMNYRKIYYDVGPHSLTGPISVRGAEAGLALRIDIVDIKMQEHGFNVRLPGALGKGLLPEDFPDGELKHFTFNLNDMTTDFAPGITIPLRPFLGIMAVSPPGWEAMSSATLGVYGGNIDVTELTAGSTLYLPVWHKGGNFRAGDAHAAQGDGEVNLMAIETAFTAARLRFTVCERETAENPWAETPEYYITLGFGRTLEEASKDAVKEMIRFLENKFSMSKSDAYTLCSIGVDLSISQLVNPVVGVHAKLPKKLFINN